MYCLDFDGVIVNSVDECCLTSYNSYFGSLHLDIKFLPQSFVDYFYNCRYLIGPAKYFYLLCKFYEKDKILTLSDIERSQNMESDLLKFENSFYENRKKLKTNLNRWCDYHSIYDEFKCFLKSDTEKFIIITNKDKTSVKQLALHFSFDNRIIEVFSKEDSLDKRILMQKIKIKYNMYASFIFVDDNRENIIQLNSIKNVECYQPLWGYINQRSKIEDFQIQAFSEIPL